ncbi:hypothetical protein CIB84_013239 [Bambusicola thoracicus]|uniref:Protein FAM173A n=1 Tax=Bambusicola thoracicus TaxID=9083 RepID=A0A2P4SFV8_BAMTH|nr:hypothetical protein CIB84_013239 [Bambusicola thoracicus]
MDAEALDELAGQLQGEALGGRGLLQLAATTGLAAYAVWAAVLMPGFRRVPLHLQANLSDCYNVIVFLAPSVKPPLAAKLLAELPDEARVVAGRFPFPSWTPSSTIGQGLEQAWAYDMKEVRRAARNGTEGCAL